MPHGLGRNAHCWCGSGKKYKKCHLNRAHEEPVMPWDAAKRIRDNFSAKYCLAPEDWRGDCANQIVKAHTIPRSGSLARIARAGHVYAFVPSLDNLTKNNGILKPQLVGIGQASTFTGFCSKHDDSIFAPVEKAVFSATPEQCFLLAYRAFAREMFTKSAQFETLDIQKELDRGRSVFDQVLIQEVTSAQTVGVEAALSDHRQLKEIFDKALQTRDFSCVEAYVVELELPPPVMCSGSFYPEQDFDGTHLQDISDVTAIPDMISVTSFFAGNSGWVVFAWLADHAPTCRRFMESLHRIPDDEIGGALVRLMFEFLENLSIQPSWWEGLSTEQQTALRERMMASMIPWVSRASAYLADDGLGIEPWPVRSRGWVGI